MLNSKILTAALMLLLSSTGYAQSVRLNAGAGFRLLKDSEVIVKNSAGGEELRQKSGVAGGLALDLHAAWLF